MSYFSSCLARNILSKFSQVFSQANLFSNSFPIFKPILTTTAGYFERPSARILTCSYGLLEMGGWSGILLRAGCSARHTDAGCYQVPLIIAVDKILDAALYI